MSPSPVIAVLKSENPLDRRVPISPLLLSSIEKLWPSVVFQEDYAAEFLPNATVTLEGVRFAPREQLLATADTIFLLKPTLADINQMKEGATLVGWCHAVQRVDFSVLAQQKKMTLIAMESMYENASFVSTEHYFFANNYLAGFEGVKHALQCVDHSYDLTAAVSVISFGAVAKGALDSLIDLGFKNITVFTRRLDQSTEDYKGKVRFKKIVKKSGQFFYEDQLLSQHLSSSQIIVNAIKQNPLEPVIFLLKEDLALMSKVLMIDISCDHAMGFSFANSTTLVEPVISYGSNYYYAVENIPALAWEVATASLTENMINILKHFIAGRPKNKLEKVLARATAMAAGLILNQDITVYRENQGAEVA